MKKHLTMRINLIVSLIIISGFLSAVYINFRTYGEIIRDDIKNISRLTSANIYSDIDNELIKPIYVSLTMANDSFLKNWLEEETTSPDSRHLSKLEDYLYGIKVKYNYDSVFMVSDQTKNYYYYEGINKIISPEDEHDDWYYTFVDKNVSYDLDVDQDEVANNALTIFINCRIVDANSKLMGVVGVGIKMDEIQKLLNSFGSEFHLDAFLISPDGTVQAHSDSEKIESVNYFDDPAVSGLKHSVIDSGSSFKTFEFNRDNQDGYLITRYIEEFNWYLIVEKNVSVLNTTFEKQIVNDVFIIGFVLLVLLVFSSFMINSFKAKLTSISRTDELTQLPNRRAFNEQLGTALKQYQKTGQAFCVIVFDVDGFKSINDRFGHLAGDLLITQIGHSVQERLGAHVKLSRWGGDEFSGILFYEMKTAAEICEDLVAYIRSSVDFGGQGITISVGLTEATPDDTFDSVLARADLGLYEAKKSGKNRVCYDAVSK
jgi:diguanylate cyclase (GGDEF)-like protein